MKIAATIFSSTRSPSTTSSRIINPVAVLSHYETIRLAPIASDRSERLPDSGSEVAQSLSGINVGAAFKSVTIKNRWISSWGADGIRAGGPTGSSFQDLGLENNGDLGSSDGGDCVILENEIDSNTGGGIGVLSGGNDTVGPIIITGKGTIASTNPWASFQL